MPTHYALDKNEFALIQQFRQLDKLPTDKEGQTAEDTKSEIVGYLYHGEWGLAFELWAHCLRELRRVSDTAHKPTETN